MEYTETSESSGSSLAASVSSIEPTTPDEARSHSPTDNSEGTKTATDSDEKSKAEELVEDKTENAVSTASDENYIQKTLVGEKISPEIPHSDAGTTADRTLVGEKISPEIPHSDAGNTADRTLIEVSVASVIPRTPDKKGAVSKRSLGSAGSMITDVTKSSLADKNTNKNDSAKGAIPKNTKPVPCDSEGFDKWKYLGLFSKDTCCPYCWKMYDRTVHIPKILPCGHNICSNCLMTDKKYLSVCCVCELDLGDYNTENSYTNLSVLDIMDNIHSQRGSGNASDTKEVPEDAYSILSGDAELKSGEYFINFVKKLEIQTQTKYDFVTVCMDTIKEKLSKLEDIKIELLNFIPILKTFKAEILRSKDLGQLSINLSRINSHLGKYIRFLSAYTSFGMNDALVIHQGICDFLKMNSDAMVLSQKEFEIMTSSNMSCHFFDDDDEGKRRYAKVELEEKSIYVFSFDEEFPFGISLFFNFQRVQQDFPTKKILLFLDIVHKKNETGYMNPNRIFIEVDSNICARRLLETFYGKNGTTFKGAEIESTERCVVVKHCMRNNKPSPEKGFLEPTKAISNLESGNVAAEASDLNGGFFISKINVCKKNKYILLGKVHTGYREIFKVKGDCIIEECGIMRCY